MKGLISKRFEKLNEAVLRRSLHDQVKINGGAEESIGCESHATDHGIAEALLGEEIGDDAEYVSEIQALSLSNHQ